MLIFFPSAAAKNRRLFYAYRSAKSINEVLVSAEIRFIKYLTYVVANFLLESIKPFTKYPLNNHNNNNNNNNSFLNNPQQLAPNTGGIDWP